MVLVVLLVVKVILVIVAIVVKVPVEAVAEVSRRGKLQERLVVVRHGCQSETTDQPTNWLIDWRTC